MELPNSGRVVIIDDNRKEIEPLIDVLSNKNIPCLYYEGTCDEKLPCEPLKGIRIVFLDLCIGEVADKESIIKNTKHVIEKTIDKANGPFLLIIWSTTGDSYLEEIKSNLADAGIYPEDIIALSKKEYFKEADESTLEKYIEIKSLVEKSGLDAVRQNDLFSDIKKIFFEGTNSVLIENGLIKLGKAIDQAILQAGILPVFVVWENIVKDSSTSLVSELYSAVPNNDKPNKKLTTVVNTLAKNVLDKRYDDASPEERLDSAISELNELYEHFYESKSSTIETRLFKSFGDSKEEEKKYSERLAMMLKDKSAFCSIENNSKFNTWKLIHVCEGKNTLLGMVYKDSKHRFKWKALANYQKDIAKIIQSMNEINTEPGNLEYVYMNINGECEVAQKKKKFIKIVPGILINKQDFETKFNVDSEKDTDSVCVMGPFTYNKIERYIVFSLDQCSYINETNNVEEEDEDSEELGEMLFVLNRKYYLEVRQKIATNYNKAGTSLFNKKCFL